MIWGVPWSSWVLSVSAAVVAVGVLVGLVVALRGQSAARRWRVDQARAAQAQLFADVVARWDDPDMLRVQRSLAGMDPAHFFAHYMQLDEKNGMKIYRLLHRLRQLATPVRRHRGPPGRRSPPHGLTGPVRFRWGAGPVSGCCARGPPSRGRAARA